MHLKQKKYTNLSTQLPNMEMVWYKCKPTRKLKQTSTDELMSSTTHQCSYTISMVKHSCGSIMQWG